MAWAEAPLRQVVDGAQRDHRARALVERVRHVRTGRAAHPERVRQAPFAEHA